MHRASREPGTSQNRARDRPLADGRRLLYEPALSRLDTTLREAADSKHHDELVDACVHLAGVSVPWSRIVRHFTAMVEADDAKNAPPATLLRAALAASAVARLDPETEAAVVETTDDPRLRGLVRVALQSAANWSRSAMMESHVLAHGDLHGWNVLLRDADVAIVDYELAH